MRWRTALGLFAVLLIALGGGTALRNWAWRTTETLRYTADIHNAFRWGTRALEHRYLGLYDALLVEHPDGVVRLDYPPLRLLVATTWVRWLRRTWPAFDGSEWPRNARLGDRTLVKPLLRLNLAAEMSSALGIFLLVRAWHAGRSPGRPGAPPFPGAAPGAPAARCAVGRWTRLTGVDPATLHGLIAALVFWFNPAVIWNAHVHPQWDTWLMPFFVFASLAATRGWWLCAGMLVAVGSMLKGQLLLVAPLFLLWPLLTGRWEAAWRWATGFLLAGALIVSPALVRSWTGALWVAGVVVAASVVSASISRSRRWETWAATVGLVGATLWPWILPGDRSAPWIGALFAAVTVAAGWWRPRARGALVAFVLAAALLTCGVVFEGSFAWLRVGFVHTATRSLRVSTPGMISNLPGILAVRFGVVADDPLWSPWWSGAVRPPTLGEALVAAYGGALVLCALGLGRQAGDPRGLAALAAPWVLLFAFLPGMQERYLVWGAGMTAMSVGIGRGLVLLHVAFTAPSCAMMVYRSLRLHRDVAPWLLRLLAALPPDAGWVILAAGLALLGTALTRRSGTGTARTCTSDGDRSTG